MKRLMIFIVSFIMISTAFADDAGFGVSKLRIQVSDPTRINSYFICMPHAGCYSLAWANKGKTYAMESGKVQMIFTTNISNDRMYTQKLPASCNLSVKPNQTLTISGNLVVKKDQAQIANLHCNVA